MFLVGFEMGFVFGSLTCFGLFGGFLGVLGEFLSVLGFVDKFVDNCLPFGIPGDPGEWKKSKSSFLN